MEEKLNEIYNELRLMDLLLYKYAYEPETVVSFYSTEDMAKYFRQFLQIILPKEYRCYKKSDTMAELVRH